MTYIRLSNGSFPIAKSTTITDIHEGIILKHILTRLEGQSLAAASCASSYLQFLCSDQKLWSDICSSSWPSTEHPLVTRAIANFTSGHRSLFYDAFPSPSHCLITDTLLPSNIQVISSVDLRYGDHLVFSKVNLTNTTPNNQSSMFRIDLFEPKELVECALKVSADDKETHSNLEKHMTLSWILISPSQNRAVNLSSLNPVFVQTNLFTEEIELTFAVVAAIDSTRQHDNYYVNYNIEITCGVKGASLELYVIGVSLTIHDINDKCLNKKESMVVLQGLLVAEKRGCSDERNNKEKYDEYIQRRNERREKRERRERRLSMVGVACVMAFLIVFWSIVIC